MSQLEEKDSSRVTELLKRVGVPALTLVMGFAAGKLTSLENKDQAEAQHSANPEQIDLGAKPIEEMDLSDLSAPELPHQRTSRTSLGEEEIQEETDLPEAPLELGEMSCGDSQFFDRLAEVTAFIEKAVGECGMNPGDIIPPRFKAAFEVSIGDRVHRALEGKDNMMIAETLNDGLTEMRFAVQNHLRDKIIEKQVAPSDKALLPPNFLSAEDLPEGIRGTFIHSDKDGTHLYYYDKVNGLLGLWQVPDVWPETDLIIGLRNAEDAAWEIDNLEEDL